MDTDRQTRLIDLETFALSQGGYFDRQDAIRYGITQPLLTYHTTTGRFERLYPGIYRLRMAPVGPYDEYILAWVWTNYRGAISHESALALYDLSDVLPTHIHVTVPRPFHRKSAPYKVHTAPLPDSDLRTYRGVQVTNVARTIVDAAATGTDPNQIRKAVQDALARGLVDRESLGVASNRHPNQHFRDVRKIIEEALASAIARTGQDSERLSDTTASGVAQ